MLFAGAGTASSSGGGGNFLIPNGTFVVELVIFLVVLGVMAKWILPPLQGVVEARRERVRGEIERAEQLHAEAAGVLSERDRVLAEARAQARGVVDDANRAAEAALSQARESAQHEYESLLEAARVEVAAERGRAREELVRRLEPLVVSAAERVLGNDIDAQRHRSLINEAVATARLAPEAGEG